MTEESKKFSFVKYRDYFFIFFGAFLLFLASPPYDLFFLAYFAVFLALIKTRSTSDSFKKGFVFGLTYNILTMYWITYVLNNYGNIMLPISVSLMIILCMYLALYYGVFFKLFFLLRNKIPKAILPLIMAVIFIFLEFIRSKILSGFPWMLLGYTQHKFTPLIQIANLSGVYGVSFIVIFFNLALSNLFLERNKKSLFNFAVAVSIIIIAGFYGIYRIQFVKRQLENKKPLTVSVIQGNIDQSQKWEKSLQKNIIDKYILLTEKELVKKPSIVVWPETALPFIYGNNIELTEYLKNFLSNKNFYLFTGFPYYDFGEDGKIYYTNSAGIFYKGELLDKYHKTHLVPFGEYVPMKKILFFVEKLVTAAGDFLAGNELKTLSVKDLKIGSLICYESIFPEISKEYKLKGANILINVTNDAWFGKSSAPYQHFAMSKFRAIENNLFLIRSANTGISGIISPAGEVLFSTPIFSDYSFSYEILY
ncbi:MAG: apolipoprotein N-acyltransferase [Proteobacteria bacterium]|nr:apolipoprotein N-acyltransferase [Pseudomonadota bacterium]